MCLTTSGEGLPPAGGVGLGLGLVEVDALAAGGEKAEEPRPLHHATLHRQAAPPTGAAHEQGMVVQTTHWGRGIT